MDTEEEIRRILDAISDVNDEVVEVPIADGFLVKTDKYTYASEEEENFFFIITQDAHAFGEDDIVAVAVSEIPALMAVLQDIYEKKLACK